ncbi:MAG TPA: hypothetical protein VLG44_00675 [Chlamydiales bacterium]|nr:hypothetical protein [Chlamydiales bacterium]
MKKYLFLALLVSALLGYADQEAYDPFFLPTDANSISLDKVRMNVVQTPQTPINNVVNHETIFTFSQTGRLVTAEYSGGRIKQGFLIGFMFGDQVVFNYCQVQTDVRMDAGSSEFTISRAENGKITLIEEFEVESRPGEYATNVLQEMD